MDERFHGIRSNLFLAKLFDVTDDTLAKLDIRTGNCPGDNFDEAPEHVLDFLNGHEIPWIDPSFDLS